MVVSYILGRPGEMPVVQADFEHPARACGGENEN